MDEHETPAVDLGLLMLNDMGIKEIYQGNTLLMQRPTSYIFVKLINSDTLGDD